MSDRDLESSERKASVFVDGACRGTNILFGVFCLIKLKLSIAGALREEEKHGKQARTFVFSHFISLLEKSLETRALCYHNISLCNLQNFKLIFPLINLSLTETLNPPPLAPHILLCRTSVVFFILMKA